MENHISETEQLNSFTTSRKAIATRESYGQALLELGYTNPDIVVVDADLAMATKTNLFRDAYPDRFFDAGIAESNMVGIAAGLAASGKTVFASSFAMFLAGRAYEQIRNTICYPGLNVKLCATHAGLTVGEDGASHQCLEDLALMRVIPGMTVISPADDIETRAAIKAISATKTPAYVRLGRATAPVVNDTNNYSFTIGKGNILRPGNDVTLIATGIMISAALEAAKALSLDGVDARVVNIHTIKPIDEELIIRCAMETGRIVTIEEHSCIGGLGSAVSDVVCSSCPCPVLHLGVRDRFGTSGSAKDVMQLYRLSPECIYEDIRYFTS